MSFPMDEIGLSDILKTVQANIMTTGSTQSLSDSQSDTDNSQAVSQNADVFDALDLSNNVSSNNQTSDSLQQAGSIIDTAGNGLTSISESLNNIKQQIQTVNQGNNSSAASISDSVKQNLANIENTAANTSFNNTNLLDGSNTHDTSVNIDGSSINITSALSDNTLKGLGLPTADNLSLSSNQDVNTLTKQVDQASQSVSSQQTIIEETKNKVVKAVGDLVVIGQYTLTPSASTTTSLTTTASSSPSQNIDAPSQLQNNAVNSVSQNPQTSLNIQTSNLDPTLLLAMLSLQSS